MRQRNDDQRRPEQGDELPGGEHGGRAGQRVEPEEKVFAAGQLIGAGVLRAAEEPEKQHQQGQLGRPPPPTPGNPQQTSHGTQASTILTFDRSISPRPSLAAATVEPISSGFMPKSVVA